jgi:DNA polymerase-4
MTRIIAHVDMDQFYAAVEMRDHPHLQGKPVIIGSDPKQGQGRGVVSTASYAARKFGVRSGQPIRQAWQLCPQGVFLPVDMERYALASQQIHQVFQRFTPMVEALSLDEAFLDLTASQKLFGSGLEMAQQIKRGVFEATRLTCSAGLAENKFLAKTASDLRKPDGLVVVPTGGGREFLAPLAIGRLWGVGEHSEPVLRNLGINTIGDLDAYPLDALARHIGARAAQDFKALARAEDVRPVEGSVAAQSIGRENTFEEDSRHAPLLRSTLMELCEDVAHRLRREQKEAGRVTLKVRFTGFETHTRQALLKPGTAHGPDLLAQVRPMLDAFLQSDARKVRLLGVSASALKPLQAQVQLTLDEGSQQRRRLADVALDAVNARFGEGTLKPAALVGPKGIRHRTGFSK